MGDIKSKVRTGPLNGVMGIPCLSDITIERRRKNDMCNERDLFVCNSIYKYKGVI